MKCIKLEKVISVVILTAFFFTNSTYAATLRPALSSNNKIVDGFNELAENGFESVSSNASMNFDQAVFKLVSEDPKKFQKGLTIFKKNEMTEQIKKMNVPRNQLRPVLQEDIDKAMRKIKKLIASKGGQEFERADTSKIVDELLKLYSNKSPDEVTRLYKLESIIRPTAVAVEKYLYDQFAAQKIEASVYRKGMKNIIPNLASWYTDPYKQKTTILGIENAVKNKQWAYIAQAYISTIPYGTAGIRTVFAFGEEFQLIADASLKKMALKVPNLKGPNTFNDEIVRSFTLGVLRWLEQENPDIPRSELKLFTAYDTRLAGSEYADLIKEIGLAYGVQVYISDEAMPLPEFSCALEQLSEGKGAVGIYNSASHNIKRALGDKLIGSDGMQLGADPIQRGAVMKEFNGATSKEVALLLEKSPGKIADDRLVFMGGEDRLKVVNYGNHQLIDTHTMHFNAVLGHIKDKEAVEKHSKSINVLYCAFHGAGKEAGPRTLRALGFPVDIIEGMHEPDGTFPEFDDDEDIDPALVKSWEKAIEVYLENHTRDELLKMDLLEAGDPDADRIGVVIRVSPEEIPENEAAAKAMGILVKLNKAEQEKYGYGALRVIPPNEWNVFIAFYDLSRLKAEGKLNTSEQRKKYFLVSTHVTSVLMQKIADHFGIQIVIKPVGVDQLADEIVKLEEQGNIVINGAEESGTYMTGNHIRDKDGFLGGLRIAEIACYARSQGKTINDILDEIYLIPDIGFCASTNNPIAYEVSVPGTAAKMAAVKFLQKEVKPLVEKMVVEGGNPVVAEYKIYAVDEQIPYRSGKYDEVLEYQNYPDAGIRLYF
ncbi:MAG: hypothetical protein KKD11_07635, partial [Candidatus Omnitrophica bacterium]|nr:hypothetical protein [Candidatus Omnitrophota bacterium]